MTGQGLKCPKCGSTHIDEFKNAYWYMCRDCGHNGMPSSDPEKAKRNFLDASGGQPNPKTNDTNVAPKLR